MNQTKPKQSPSSGKYHASMPHSLSLILFLLTAVLLTAACTGPLPIPTAVPPEFVPTETATATPAPAQAARATATPLPTETPLPTATATQPPLPTATPAIGYYRHPELGFWFHYPSDWFVEDTGSNLPAVIISDNDDPVRLIAGGRGLEEGTELADFAQTVKDDLGLAETVELLADSPTTLSDSSPAWQISLQWQDEEGSVFQGEGVVAVSGTNGYVVMLIGRPEVITARSNTIAAIAATLTLEQPEFYGVSRENGLVLITPEPATLDPALTTEGAAGLTSHLFSGLVRLNSNLQLEPDLAESWEVSADGTVYTFSIRNGVTFHDDSNLTAVDIKASWDRATDPGLNSPTAPLHLKDIVGAAERMAGQSDSISGIEVVDAFTLRVTLNAANAAFLAKLTQPVTFVTSAANVADGGNWWQEPIGTGPFSLRRWQGGQVLILDSNEEYYGTPPTVEAIVYLFGSAGFSAYESGLVDVAPVGPINLSRAQDPGEPLSADLVSSSVMCTRRIVFNTRQAPFNDPAMRQAFSLALDRQQLAQVVLNNSAVPAVGVLPPGMPGFIERPFADQFNLEQAQNLIASANIPPLTLVTNGGTPDALTIAIADAWATNLGVTIETQLVTDNNYLAALAEQDGNLFTVDWCADYPDPENMLDLLYHSQSPANVGGYTNAELDGLLEAARSEADPAQRIALYQQAEEIVLAEAASVQTVYPLAYVLVRPYIQGYQLTAVPTLWPAVVTIAREEQ
jgi:ABC-type transport system substrate-binding protein